jgi:putative transposase
VRPDTVLRWHHDLVRRRHAERSRHKRPGRPRTITSIRRLVLRLVHENPSWGYRRVHGEPATLGIGIAASTVWQILKDADIDPAPERAATTWASFLRSRPTSSWPGDFLKTVTLSGQHQYVLAIIEHATRRIRILGATAHPTAAWVTQAARNDAGTTVRYLIRDRDAKFPVFFNKVLADAGITMELTGSTGST